MKKLLYQTYLQAIKKSVGARLFQNLYVEENNKVFDVLKNGSLSCAHFASNILLMFGAIKSSHATVNSTVKDMIDSGNWKKVQKRFIKEGDVIIWEEIKYADKSHHRHIGFYIGGEKAVSHSDKKLTPARHHYTFNGKRNIDAIYRYIKW